MKNSKKLILSELRYFPVKSLRGVQSNVLPIGRRGFEWDRHWMLVDEAGRFLTQRQHARMSLIEARVEQDLLLLETEGQSPIRVSGTTNDSVEVEIWGDRCMARVPDKEANAWLSAFLGVKCQLVYLPTDTRRQVDQDYADPADEVGFADGFPFLLISQASLDDLNDRLEQPVPMVRFRPNLVVTGTEPYEEDSWRRIRIGSVDFRVVKPCSRCIIPTINPETAERSSEPLATLSRYRKSGNKVYFGQNLIHEAGGQGGRLEEGMEVEVIE